MPCIPSVFNLSRDCAPRMGGISEIVWAKKASIDATSPTITSPPGADYEIELETDDHVASRIRGRGSFQSVAQVNEDTGQVYYRDELNFQPEKSWQEDFLHFVDALSRADDDDIFVIVLDNNGLGWIMGYGFNPDGNVEAYPVFLTAAPVGTGADLGDLNGGSVTLASVHPRVAAIALFNPDIA